RFIAEQDRRELSRLLAALRAEGTGFTVDLVGEATVSETEAVSMLGRYEALVVDLAAVAAAWPEVDRIDRDDRGPLRRVDVSVKASSLYARFDPLDADAERVVAERLRRLLRRAADAGARLTVDMEQRSFKDATLAIFRRVVESEDLGESPPVSIALQAYLPETAADVTMLIEWA